VLKKANLTQQKQTSIWNTKTLQTKPATERVRALANISRSAICCHSNETRAPIANPPNSAQSVGYRNYRCLPLTCKFLCHKNPFPKPCVPVADPYPWLWVGSGTGAQPRFQSWGPWSRLLYRTKYGWYTQFRGLRFVT